MLNAIIKRKQDDIFKRFEELFRQSRKAKEMFLMWIQMPRQQIS